MRITLIGHGKMGQTIEQIALARGHNIAKIIDAGNVNETGSVSPANTDIAIEFTTPDTAFNLIYQVLNQGVRVISGTTGWLDRLEEIKKLCHEKKGAFFYASNYSIGANLFFRLNRQLAKLMNNHGYQPAIEEKHHIEKKDAPSGTAITLAEDILQYNSTLERWVNGEPDEDSDLPIKSLREADVPGTHEISYTSIYDKIQIKHTAFSRLGFAEGAVLAAEWLKDKQGVFTMDDFLNS
jgi:4-hydroxy-tetrahydrodipicolinate reductase